MPSSYDLYADLASWSRSLPLWQQYALYLLETHATPSEEEADAVYKAFLAAHELGGWHTSFSGYALGEPDHPGRSQPGGLRLKQLRVIEGVNALPPGEYLDFGPQLTVIYGPNASGKSGFARILASVCRTAGGHRQVLGDVFKGTQSEPRARIVLADNQGKEWPLEWPADSPPADLACFSYFDRTSAEHYVSESTPLLIGPPLLRRFDQLASLIAGPIRDRLRADIQAHRPEARFGGLLGKDTEVARLIRDLGSPGAGQELQALSHLTPEEIAEFEGLPSRIADLSDARRTAALDLLRQQEATITRLATDIAALEAELSDRHVAGVRAAQEELTAATLLAERAGAQTFFCDGLAAIGSEEWRAFLRAAEGLAAREGHARGEPYPTGGDICLLCHQPLGADALRLLRAYATYLEEEAEERLVHAVGLATLAQNSLAAIVFDQLDEDKAAVRVLEDLAPEFLPVLREYVVDLRRRRDAMLELLGDTPPESVPSLPVLPVRFPHSPIERIRARIEELRTAATVEKLAELRQRHAELLDRKVLADNVDAAHALIQSYAWAARASGALRALDTGPITRKHTQVCQRVVSDAYVQRFIQECKYLGLKPPICATVYGERGQARRQLHLKAVVRCETTDVLSEGEQRIASLADFLTEVSQWGACAGIVLDDPVSSLDHHSRHRIAERLCQEANHRQVVVFTHSLEFLCSLHTESKRANLKTMYHWVERTESGPGVVSLNDAPPPESKYKTTQIAREHHQRAKATKGSERLDAVMAGFGALRATCEYFVCHTLLAGVVTRFDERLNISSLRDIALDEDVVEQAIALHGMLSRHIDAHLRANTGRSDPPPGPAELNAAVLDFDVLLRQHRGLPQH